jgi:hypothetical protein
MACTAASLAAPRGVKDFPPPEGPGTLLYTLEFMAFHEHINHPQASVHCSTTLVSLRYGCSF